MKSRYVEILKALAAGPLPGMFGNDIVRVTGVSRLTVYTDLDMLVAGGFIEEHEVSAQSPGTLVRTRHVITPKGRLAIEDQPS